MKIWLRKKILDLIGEDIDRIAGRAYNDGCYVTANQMRAERQIEFANLVAHNEKLTKMMTERISITMPPIAFPADSKQEGDK